MKGHQKIDEILELIKIAWESSPDQRFCQLIINIGLFYSQCPEDKLFDLKDKDFIYGIKKMIEVYKSNEKY